MNGLDFGTAIGLIKGLGSPDPAVIESAVSDWLDDHPEATTTVEDGAISYAKLNSSLQGTVDDVADLKSHFVDCRNLFNPHDPDIATNSKISSYGIITSETGYSVSGYVPVEAGKTYCFHYPTGVYGGSSSIVLYDSTKTRVAGVNPERLTDVYGHGYLKYTIPADSTAVYVRMTIQDSTAYYYMYIAADTMPSEYVPFTTKQTLENTIVDYNALKNVSVSKGETDFIKQTPQNLVDLSAMVVGIVSNSSSSGDVDASVTNRVTTDYIPVEPGETYSLVVYPGVYYGSGYRGTPYYDANKNYLGRVVQSGGSTATAELTTITIPNNPNIKYIRTSYALTYKTNPKQWYNTMIVKGSTWPGDMYIYYDDTYRINGAALVASQSAYYNCLFGKTAIWDGDSICAADDDGQGGWPERIAKMNGMRCFNNAKSGGTIAVTNVSGLHSVVDSLNTLITAYPDSDYIIIEGGTNDADRLGTEGIGTYDESDFSAEYIAALDDETFSGALEIILHTLVTERKGKHIGYIIPQKMGHTDVLVARRRTYFDRAIAICQKWGVPYLDLWNGSYFNWELSAHWDQTKTSAQNEAAGNLYQDGQHLTTTGYAIQSPIIAEWMKGI